MNTTDQFKIDSYEASIFSGIGANSSLVQVLNLKGAAQFHGYYSNAVIYGVAGFGPSIGTVVYNPSQTQIVTVYAFITDVALNEFINILNANHGAGTFTFQFVGAYGAEGAQFPVDLIQITPLPASLTMATLQTKQLAKIVSDIPHLAAVKSQLLGI